MLVLKHPENAFYKDLGKGSVHSYMTSTLEAGGLSPERGHTDKLFECDDDKEIRGSIARISYVHCPKETS